MGYDTSPEGRHTYIFFERLKSEGYVTEYHNMAKSGFTTSDLLEMLHNVDRKKMKIFRNASVITLNIGGNNILQPFLAYTSEMRLLSGISDFQTGYSDVATGSRGFFRGIMSGFRSVFSDTLETNFRDVGQGFRDIATGIGGMATGTWDIVRGSPGAVSVLRGSLSSELEAMLDECVLTFTNEFKEIILWIETKAPNAIIITNTIFNPIPQDILMVSVPLSNWANIFIESINTTIIEESKTSAYLVTDIYSHFSHQTNLMSFNLNPFSGSLSLDLVHPNATGHRLIAELNYQTLKQGEIN
jgi:lysophospholipase L1-like esterase